MNKRVVPGLLIAGLWLLLLLKGSPQLFGVIAVLTVFWAADEYLRMIDTRNIHFLERWVLNVCLTAPVALTCIYPQTEIIAPAFLGSFFVILCYFLYRYKKIDDNYNFFCRLVFGIFYLGLLGSHIVLLRFSPEGSSWLIVGTAITSGSDTGAYFVGRAIGKRKLCPNISPNKTVEGAIGGVFAGLIAGLGFAHFFLPSFNWFALVAISVVLALVGILGDLTESIIKRGTGTKDSGRCLAGHGGILDRVDSLLFVVPVLYYILVLSGLK
jgi:phosphatidate cytidylyltransferase